MFTKPHITFFLLIIAMVGCNQNQSLHIEVFETSADGNKLTKISEFPTSDSIVEIQLNPKEKYQKIILVINQNKWKIFHRQLLSNIFIVTKRLIKIITIKRITSMTMSSQLVLKINMIMRKIQICFENTTVSLYDFRSLHVFKIGK